VTAPNYDPQRIAEDALLTVEEGDVRITATRTKGTRPYVRLYVGTDLHPIHLNICNPAIESAREKFAKKAPAPHVETVHRMLVQLAERLAACPVGTLTDASDATPKKALFAETVPHPEPVALGEVLDQCRSTLRRYAVLPPHADVTLALWVTATHFLDHLHYFGILHVVSTTRESGKTRVLELVHLLAAKAWSLVSPTLSTLFRVIEASAPTVIMDEADTLAPDTVSAITALLNDGVKRGGCIPRTERNADDQHEVATYAIFCPKAIGSIDVPFPDATVSRTVRITMTRATPTELATLDKFREDHAERRWGKDLRGRLARAAADHGPAVKAVLDADDDHQADDDHEVDAGVVLPDGVDGRQAQIWEPLLALAECAGGGWPRLAREACTALVKGLQSAETVDHRMRMLAELQTYFAEHPDRTFATSDELIAWLTADESRGWLEYGRKDLPITPTALARLVKGFGVKPKSTRAAELPDGKARAWAKADFAPVWARYFPVEIIPVVSQNGGTSETHGTHGTESASRVPLVPAVPCVPPVPDSQRNKKEKVRVIATNGEILELDADSPDLRDPNTRALFTRLEPEPEPNPDPDIRPARRGGHGPGVELTDAGYWESLEQDAA